jgi:hypothetical protein
LKHEEKKQRDEKMVFDYICGMTIAELAKKYDLTMTYVYIIMREAGQPIRNGEMTGVFKGVGAGSKKIQERDKVWQNLYLNVGLNMAEIGNIYGVTRECVRQRMEYRGFTKFDGKQWKDKQAEQLRRDTEKIVLREETLMKRYGIDMVTWAEIGAEGRKAYVSHRKNSWNRGLEFTLTMGEWYTIWKESGKWNQRGRASNKYCMGRKDITKGYTKENSIILSIPENGHHSRTYYVHNGAASGSRGGVYMLYPRANKPWVARAGKRSLGHFATEREARAAREQHLQAA